MYVLTAKACTHARRERKTGQRRGGESWKSHSSAHMALVTRNRQVRVQSVEEGREGRKSGVEMGGRKTKEGDSNKATLSP